MKIKSFQVDNTEIVEDHDSILHQSQIFPLMLKIFGLKNIKFEKIKGFVPQFIINNKYALIARNLTWLGYDKGSNDYRKEKKRIQIPINIMNNLLSNNQRGLKTFYLGIYSYEKEKDFLYVLFDSQTYNKNGKNASKHISVFDLLSARRRGYFFKLDKNGNRIFILNQNNFLDSLINDNSDIIKQAEFEYKLLQYLQSFWNEIPIELKGSDCYKEMFDDGYVKTFETEWIGYYHEYLFEKFLNKQTTDLIELYGDKKRNGIDIDLKINIGNNFYADLKSDNEDYGIQGNKKETIDKILNNEGHIWYIVASFNEVIMDETMNYETCNYFNKILNDNLLLKKIQTNAKLKNKHNFKYKLKLKEFYILDLNSANRKYLVDYKQGKNSNSKARGIKIKISKKMLDEFKIFSYTKK